MTVLFAIGDYAGLFFNEASFVSILVSIFVSKIMNTHILKYLKK